MDRRKLYGMDTHENKTAGQGDGQTKAKEGYGQKERREIKKENAKAGKRNVSSHKEHSFIQEAKET